jgi:hypothetical protein
MKLLERDKMIQIPCEICGKLNEDERAIFEQNEHFLCLNHYGIYDDDELEERIKNNERR